jgi:hypothetical protein
MSAMTNLKHVLSTGLAGAAFVSVLTTVLGGPTLLQSAGIAAILAISAVALSAAALGISWNRRSFLVMSLLGAAGIIQLIPPLSALARVNFAITFPGPIIGVIFGLAILGVIKGIKTASMSAVASKETEVAR